MYKYLVSKLEPPYACRAGRDKQIEKIIKEIFFKSKFFKKIKIPIGIKIMNNGMRFQPKNLTKFSIPVKTYGMPVFELVCTGSCDTYTAVSTILPNNVSYPAASILYDVMGSMIIRKIVNTIRYFKNTFNLSFLNLIKNIIDIPKNKNNPSERINDANVIIANETNIIFLFSEKNNVILIVPKNKYNGSVIPNNEL